MRAFCLALILFLLAGGRPAAARASYDRVGVVADRQGTALVRPVGRDRWSPLGPRSLLEPGDLVRTPARGAHAVEIRLAAGGSLLLGPGSLVELAGPGRVFLHAGTVELKATPEHPVTVTGPGDFKQTAKGRLVLSTGGRETTRLARDPKWLTGYRASTTDEWMGSLLASVDGREVALSVGYHKVTVDVRDQIARTTVEESFLNDTSATLEGVFHFPLPAGASVSGFGMWIGGELVEADIVEKQRARAIYEQILRERKDPGLLEWSGGNLFKARVFPIAPHSEKRIRIRYTQVLPLEGDRLRYRYALRSELLRRHPLRELRIDVRVDSTMPIRSIASPTHTVRARHTEHAASAEFEAQEFAPDRDFEVVVELDRSDPLSVVTHRRGEDGYFMLLLSPPDAVHAGLRRQLVPERGPALDVVVMADTSGSMDRAARAAQAAFVQALLGLLGEKDRFRLLAFDLDAQWFDERPAPPSRADEALAWLEKRASLGWTDLDRAFAALDEKTGPETLVVCVGDGIGTTGDADPVALARRLRRPRAGVFHAVAPSSAYEQGVLEAIASLGGGSVRAIGDDPSHTAFELLSEAAQPAVKDLQVSFEGIRVARVYPETLPNLAAGRQQVILGRFLPGEQPQRGRVAVTGTLQGEPVRYAAELKIPAADAGNSFLPRLWARHHIDALLAQGNTPEIRNEVVAFSERMGVMTPFTSFLVLESDADRERFGVTRRVKMSDGERFFAEGRDRASTELLRQQMKRARAWRLRLRRRMLQEIATLGEHLHEVARGATESAAPISFGAAGGKAGGEDRSLGKRMRLAEEPEAQEPAPDAEADYEEPEEYTDGDAGDDERAPAKESAADSLEGASRGRGGLRPAAYRPPAGYLSEQLRRGGGSAPAGPGFASMGFPALEVPGLVAPAGEPDWPAEAIALLRSLDRRPALAALATGLELRLAANKVHPLHGRPLTHERARGLIGPAGWFVRTETAGQEPFESWRTDGERGVLAAGLRLGRRRAPDASDRARWPFPLADFSRTDLVAAYGAAWKASAPQERETGVVEIVLEARNPTSHRALRLRIDTARHVLVEWASLGRGRVVDRLAFSGFVQAGGLWWATRITRHDREDRVVLRWKLTVAEKDPAALQAELAAAVAHHDDVLFLGARDPSLAGAKQALHENKANFADRLRLALHFFSTQQWARVFEQWEAAEALAAGKPGAAWIRLALLNRARRGTQLAQALHAQAAVVARAAEPALAFLAGHCLQLGRGVLTEPERLALLDALKPAYARDGRDAALRWLSFRRARANALRQVGRDAEARAIQRAILAERAWDVQAHLDLIDALHRDLQLREAASRAAAAIRGQKWLVRESDLLFDRWTNALWALRDVEALDGVCAQWVAQKPESSTAYERRLSVLLFAGRENEADRIAAALLEKKWAEPTTLAQRAELGAAIRFALGRGWNYYAGTLEEKWYAPLAGAARRLMRLDDTIWQQATTILSDWRLRRTDEYRALQAHLLEDLRAAGALESLPLDKLGHYLGNLAWQENRVDAAVFDDVAARLRRRWDATRGPARAATLANLLLRLLDAHAERDAALGVLRTWLERADEARRPQVARRLGERLMTLDWSEKTENELLALVPAALPARRPPAAREAGDWIRRVAGHLFTKRVQALLGPAGEREKLSRAALKRRRIEARATARRALAERFARAREAAGEAERAWYEIERLGWLARLGEPAAEVDAGVRELFSGAGDKRDGPRLVRERCAYVLAYLATRRDAPEARVNAAIDFLRARTADAEPDVDWRYHLFRLLVALDRTGELETTLAGWISPAKADQRWRVARGYFHAEHGRLAEAVRAFEAVESADELGPAEYDALAAWYLVLGRDADRERALVARLKTAPEYALSRRLYAERNRLARRGEGVPGDFDPDSLRVLRVLLFKSSRPERWIGHAQSLYSLIKDFRLLDCLAYGVLGHTPDGIYPFLQRAGSLLGGVHEEATCDQLVRHLDGRLARKGLTAADRRGLLLLKALAERRASEVLDEPGPHAARALQALRDAAEGRWLPGERVRLAGFLASLGAVPDAAFGAEQLRLLRRLREEVETPRERLQVALCLARTLWAHGKQDAALDGLLAAISESRTDDRPLDREGHVALRTVVDWLASRNRFARAQRLVLDELARRPAPGPRRELHDKLYTLWAGALRSGGALAEGRGEALYDALRRRMEASLWSCPADWIPFALQRFGELHKAALRGGIRRAGRDFERFALERLPELLTRTPHEASDLLRTAASMLQQLRGARAALAVALDRLEREPAWLRRIGRSVWQRLGWDVARWRAEAGGLGDLEPRLERVVLAALERDLQTMSSVARPVYWRGRWFWSQKRDAFWATTRKVIELNPRSAGRLRYAAGYLWNGLGAREAAVDTLFAAESRGVLDEGGRAQLVGWLHKLGRWEESLPLLEHLVSERPGRLDYRVQRIRALHETGDDKGALALLDATSKLWRTPALWNERALAPLARVCLACRYHERARTLYDELIPLHQRTHRNRGVGDGVLSAYQGELARCHVALGDYDKAVDAASAAIVSWGRTQRNRQRAIAALRDVLERIPELEAWIARYDARVAQSGLDAPLLRKTLGSVLLARGKAQAALVQLLSARDLQPADEETHRELLRACDLAGKAREACGVLLDSLALAPRAYDLYEELGRRFARLGDARQSERAWTGLVEAAPHEAEGHRRLALHRESAARFTEAAEQWRQVVRVRTGEPDGWFGLVRALAAAGEVDAARAKLEEMLDRAWEERFGDVKQKAAAELARLKAKR